ncbi:serine protease family protein [Mucilaginibacter agri]|uniref:Uncharacterized protein n=1 Tax=Mucilaginibacter agri TaxID=2695265 RepID=A0A966DUA3_9SPHI|nr:hypothetical protein [Mucilaginibacter agri]NCD70226.1 hypothetical protein [Mucilaginibacter agri]
MSTLPLFLLNPGLVTNPVAGVSPPSDFLNDLIAISMVLFMLSVIVEKITALIRKYAPFKMGMWLSKRNVKFWQNIGKKSPLKQVPLKKIIEREVYSLSFIIGLFIAVTFRVDLFRMISAENAKDVLFWTKPKWDSYDGFWDTLLLVISLGLTGFFLTFGSKFFHDLLETLFQVRDVKQKLQDENTFNQGSIASFDEFFKTSYATMVDTAITQNQQLLTSPDMIGPPRHGKMLKNGQWVDCIEIHLTGAATGTIPPSVVATLNSGQKVSVPVNIISDIGTIKVLSSQGDTVDATTNPTYQGTICCRIVGPDTVKKLLTCSHVIVGGSGKNFFGAISPPIAAQVGGIAGAQFVWAQCDISHDMALLTAADNAFNYAIQPGKPRVLGAPDLMKTVTVVRQGGNTIKGKIVNYCVTDKIPIRYTEGFLGVINLIVLSNVTTNGDDVTYVTLTAGGDSGSAVYDTNNNPIGMIIAGDDKFSYALSLVSVLNSIQSTITT